MKDDFEKGLKLLYGGDEKRFHREMLAQAKRLKRSKRKQGRS